MNIHIRTGVDLMRISRIERVIQQYGDRFITRIFTIEERAICGDRAQSYAARWAAKEAVAKLLGTGIRGLGSDCDYVSWHSIEICHNAQQKPIVCLHDQAAEIARQQKLHSIDISLSHDGDYVIASAVALQIHDKQENELC